jgi:hypothetical protein
VKGFRPCGFSALRPPLAAHTAMFSFIRFTPIRLGHALRSLFLAAFRYPLPNPHMTWPDLSFDPATLLGFFLPFAVFPVRGSGRL